MKTLLFFLGFLSLLDAEILDVKIAPFSRSNQFGSVKILDQKKLAYKEINGIGFSEISDAAYNAKSQKLYFVGDEGKLFVFDAVFGKKIETLTPMSASVLGSKAKTFSSADRDSEGLALNAKGEIFISFEGKAKIGRFDDKGSMLQSYVLPAELRDTRSYRSRNKSLEALAWHPTYGLLCASEWSLKHRGRREQVLYALNGTTWEFKAEAEPKSAVVAIEVMDDGNVLVLERSYDGAFAPLVITLKKVYLTQCSGNNKKCKTEVLLKMNSHEGWMIDNFEGLSRVSRHRYVMISDDNNNFFQQTLLVYFEINEQGDKR
jgi:hypothetical protein